MSQVNPTSTNQPDKQTEGRFSRPSVTPRTRKDQSAQRTFFGVTVLPVLLILIVTVALFARAWPIMSAYPLRDLLLGEVWKPNDGLFGFWPFLLGTVWVTGVGVLLSVPACLLVSIYLAEYAHTRTRSMAKPILDLLAAIPPGPLPARSVAREAPLPHSGTNRIESALVPGRRRSRPPLRPRDLAPASARMKAA